MKPLHVLLPLFVCLHATPALANTTHAPEPSLDTWATLPALPAFETPDPARIVTRTFQAFLQVAGINLSTATAEAPDVMLPMLGLIADQSARMTPEQTPERIRFSSRYGQRFHPVLRRWKLHNGVDFAAPRGTPVHACDGGVVTFAGWKGAAGRYVRIKHDNGYVSSYMHLHRIHVSRGDRVERSAPIGQIGTTGRSTGPHLHFSIAKDGAYINPLGDHDFNYAPPVRGTGLLIHYERQLARTQQTPEQIAQTLTRWARRSPALLDQWPQTHE